MAIGTRISKCQMASAPGSPVKLLGKATGNARHQYESDKDASGIQGMVAGVQVRLKSQLTKQMYSLTQGEKGGLDCFRRNHGLASCKARGQQWIATSSHQRDVQRPGVLTGRCLRPRDQGLGIIEKECPHGEILHTFSPNFFQKLRSHDSLVSASASTPPFSCCVTLTTPE